MGNGVLTPSDPDAAEEWLEFNASVRRAGERKGRLSFLSRGGLERGGDRSTLSRVGLLPSREAERWGAVEGLGREPSSEAEIAPRVRGGLDGPHCVRGLRIGL